MLFVALAVVLGWIIFVQDAPDPPVEPIEPGPALQQLPLRYQAQADGTITIEAEAESDGLVSIESVETSGRVRLNYTVYPNNRVAITLFNVWAGDADIAVNFAFVELDRIRLRCLIFYSDRAIIASLQGDRIIIPAGTEVLGHFFDRRGPDGQCSGPVRRTDHTSPGVLELVHDPQSDHFDLRGSFTVEVEGHEVAVELSADGAFLNRPPVADFVLSGTDVLIGDDGCPIPIANTPQGLELSLRSTSYDFDGNFPPGSDIKVARVDISREQWAHRSPAGFAYLGGGRDGGTHVFATGQEHQLMLWVTDRQAFEARKICTFRVKEPS